MIAGGRWIGEVELLKLSVVAGEEYALGALVVVVAEVAGVDSSAFVVLYFQW